MSQSKTTESYKPEKLRLLPKIINGGIAGMISFAIVFPLDLVKTRLQNQPIGPNGERMYTSMFDCFKKTIKAEGILGMYRGSAVTIMMVTPEKAVKLSANDFFRYHLTTGPGQLPLEREMIAGGLAGLAQVIVTNPMELLKIQLQDAGRAAVATSGDLKAAKGKKAAYIAYDIMKNQGIFGFYKGAIPCVYRDVIFSLIFFPMYARLNSIGPRKSNSDEPAFYWSFFSGCASGSTSALAVTPFDVVKTRLQAITKDGSPPKYTGFTDTIIKTFKSEGIRAFFKGGACRMIVIAPVYGIAMTIYYLGIAEKLLSLF